MAFLLSCAVALCIGCLAGALYVVVVGTELDGTTGTGRHLRSVLGGWHHHGCAIFFLGVFLWGVPLVFFRLGGSLLLLPFPNHLPLRRVLSLHHSPVFLVHGKRSFRLRSSLSWLSNFLFLEFFNFEI